MECCLCGEKREQLRIHKGIERHIQMDRQKSSRELKLLVLGTEESGKSTLMKQAKITHAQGYNEDEKKEFIEPVYRNIITAIQALINAMKILNITYVNGKNMAYADKLIQVEVSMVSTLEDWQVEAIRNVWSDNRVQICYCRRREYRLSDNARHFLGDLDRIAAPSYIPTVQDILRVRVPTTAITEYSIHISTTHMRIINAGGLRSSMRKWIHCFESVSSIIFMVALNQYDQVSQESHYNNRLQESLALFQCVLAYPWLKETSIILLLNKRDLLEEKITQSDLETYFPEYRGPKRDAEAARHFIQQMFVEYSLKRQGMYYHAVCVTEIDEFRMVFGDVKDTILLNCLRKYEQL